MAVVNVKSALLTNRDAVPRQLNQAANDGARVRSKAGTVEAANGDSIGSTYRFCSVPSNARINSIRVFCDAITSGAMDIGLYQTTANGGAVLLATAYATAQSIASANVTGIECMFEAKDIANVANRVYQDGGLTTDPTREYDIVGTLTAAAAAAGTISMIVEYCVD